MNFSRMRLLPWLVAVVVLALWEISARAMAVLYFVPPTRIVVAARDLWLSGPASRLWTSDLVTEDVIPSIVRLILGWAIAIVLGVLLGIVLGTLRWLDEYLSPVLEFSRAMPPVALVPIFILLFGIGSDMKVLLIAFTTIWPILLNTIDGVRSVEPTLIATADVFSIPKKLQFWKITVPSVMPRLFAALKITSALALIVMVISEMIGSSDGIGFRLLYAEQHFEFPEVWAGILLLGVIGIVLNVGVTWAENRVLSWLPPAELIESRAS